MTLKIEAGKKYRTRGGHEVEILRTDVRDEQPVVGIISFNDELQCVTEWSADGSFWTSGKQAENDIISEIRPKRVVWMNVYEGDEGANFFSSRQEADADYLRWADSTPTRIACIRVEFEEGRFDE